MRKWSPSTYCREKHISYLKRLIAVASIILFFTLKSVSQSVSQRDSSYIFALLDTAEHFFSSANYKAAFKYCDNAAKVSRQLQFKKGIAYSLIERTDIYIDQDLLDSAGSCTSQTFSIGKYLKDTLITAIATMQSAQIKMYRGKFDDAISLFQNCTAYFSTHPSKYAALAFNDFGFTYGQKGEPQKQAACLIKALEIYDKMENADISDKAVVLSNLSTLYYSLGQKEKAIEFGERSIEFRKITGDISKLSLGYCNLSQIYLGINNDKAEQYQQLGLKYAEQSGDESRIIGAFITSSLIASGKKDYKSSIEYEKRAIELLEKSRKNPVMLARRYIAVGIDYDHENTDSLSVITYFNKAFQLSKQLQSKTNLRDIYYHLTHFYKAHHNYEEAYNSLRKYIDYRDSIINDNTRTSIAEIETKYQTAKKDAEIENLNAAQRIKELQIEKQKALITGSQLEVQRKEKEIQLLSQAKELQELKISQQSEQLEKQILLSKNNEQELKLAEQDKQLQRRELQSQKHFRNLMIAGIIVVFLLAAFLFNRFQLQKKLEHQQLLLEMRNDISRNLHDDIGASLSNINILNELAKRNVLNPEKANTYLSKSGDDIQRISESLSDIVWNINPQYDNLDNLFVRMKRYAADMLEGKNIQAELLFPDEKEKITIPMDQRRDFYLIFKEAVNNLAKYSKAASAKIVVEVKEQFIHLTLTDDGQGFDLKNAKAGNGLQNMKQRAGRWMGKFDIQSAPGKGTSVSLFMKIH